MLLACAVVPVEAVAAQNEAQVSVFVVTPGDSTIQFFVKASVALEGTFHKWHATLTFTSPELSTDVLDIKIQPDSVDT